MAVLIYLIEGTGELLATLTIKLFDVQVTPLPLCVLALCTIFMHSL